MIHAFAIEPRLVATWGRRAEFRYIHDKFGLGTPRVLLELPKFSTWKKAVYDTARELGLSDEDMKRVEELFRVFAEHKHRRGDSIYEGVRSWLENAEQEHVRRPFTGILATENPRSNGVVLVPEQLDAGSPRWTCPHGATTQRTADAIATTLAEMLTNCRELHLIDPHFGPENARHRKVLQAFMDVLARGGVQLELIRVHCGDKNDNFERDAQAMAGRLPFGVTVEFVRWRERAGGEEFHNRYVLTDVGGVMLGVGLDAGSAGATDDVLILPRPQYELHWRQYVNETAFDCVDRPAKVVGRRR